ncbi:CoA transferase [Mesorhizobium sp. 1M-11]|uniref:CoA transferase n=1 Tax=Mesorhizobium sp. 1M-11 TaxID=1529006 RepID=UPI0006C76E7A|nr:CoA transferase [Mesorhizobium sp. 1M-11]
MTPAYPYEGLTVVEAVGGPPGNALRLAAAMAGRIFADLGAKVIQVEDHAPQGSEAKPSATSLALQRFLSARKSVVDSSLDDAFLTGVLRKADVAIVDRHVHGSIAAKDLPKKVALLSLFGGSNAETEIAATEFTIAALGGFLNMVGDAEREPLKLVGHQEAYALGLATFSGLSASLARESSSKMAATIRASLLDIVVWLNWKAVPLEADAPIPPGRAGAAAEWRIVRCADGWIALVYQEPDWPHLCTMVRDERIRQGKFATRQGRLENAVELADLIEQAFLSRTRRQLHEEALSFRLPLGPVWAPEEALGDPHNAARRLFEELPRQRQSQNPIFAPRLPLLWNGSAFSNTIGDMPVATPVGIS